VRRRPGGRAGLMPKKSFTEVHKDNLYAARMQIAMLSGTVARIYAHLGLKEAETIEDKCNALSVWVYKQEGYIIEHTPEGDVVGKPAKPIDEPASCPF